MAEQKAEETTYFCSFCGKSQHQVNQLLANTPFQGPPTVFICDGCLVSCIETCVWDKEPGGVKGWDRADGYRHFENFAAFKAAGELLIPIKDLRFIFGQTLSKDATHVTGAALVSALFEGLAEQVRMRGPKGHSEALKVINSDLREAEEKLEEAIKRLRKRHLGKLEEKKRQLLEVRRL